MDTIKRFAELGSLLAETKWGQGDSELAKYEGDSLVFPQRKKRVGRKDVFKFKLGENIVEHTAEQIAECYRTRDEPLQNYLRHMRKGSVSTINRPAFLALMQEGNFAAAEITSAGPSVPSASALAASGDDSQRKRDRTAQRLSDVLKAEVRYYDRNVALNAVRSFQEVIDLDSKAKTVLEEQQRKAKQQKRSKPLGSPIIVVPPNATALLNLYNIKSFLEDMNYVSTEEILKKNPNETKPDYVYVTRRKHPQAGDIRFKVVDSVVNFDNAMWDRVVAVFVSGQAWQLKDWKWPSPADIFDNVKGFHVYFDDAKLSDLVKGWNVAALPIKHHSRNKDIVQVHEIWRQIDSQLERKKPQILQNLIDEYEARLRAEREARLKGMQAQMEEEEEDEDEDLNASQVMIDA